MSTLRPKQLDNLPVDVANALAQEIFSWADQSKGPYAKGQIAGEGEEAPGRIARDLTFSSLSRLSSQSLHLWRPFQFKHIRLDTSHLAPFCTIFQRDSEQVRKWLGCVRHLVFLDSASRMMANSKESDEKTATDYLKSKGAPSFVLNQPSHFKVGSAGMLMGIDAALELIKIYPRQFAGLEKHLEFGLGREAHQLSSRICSDVRALIINSCIDVKKLDVNGCISSIPFCTRLSVGNAATPLLPFTQQLEEINIKKWEANSSNSNQCHSPDITCSNVVWLLLEIPCLRKASFYASFDRKDAKFLADHGEVTYSKRSWVEDLELDILPSDRMSGDLISACMGCLLRYTNNVNSFSFEYRIRGGLTQPVEDGFLEGLTRSFDKVKSLSIDNVHFARDDSTFNRLFNFPNLEYLSFSIDGLLSLASPILYKSDVEGSNSKTIPILPPSLKEIHFTFNPKANQGEVAASFPENTLAQIIRSHPKPSKLRTVTVVSLGNGRGLSKAREGLREVCEEAGIKLISLDRYK